MNKAKFKAKQTLHGDTNETLATFLGMDRHTLGMKINDESQFRIDEVAMIVSRYGLTPEETHEIFFK